MILAKQELELILNFYFFTSTVEKRAPSTPAEMHRRSRKMVPFKLLNDETTPPPCIHKKGEMFSRIWRAKKPRNGTDCVPLDD